MRPAPPNGKHLITNQIHFISTTQIPSPMELTPLHRRIRELARNQYHEKGLLNLSDLAAALRPDFPSADLSETALQQAVCEAYEHYRDNALRTQIVDGTFGRSVVDQADYLNRLSHCTQYEVDDHIDNTNALVVAHGERLCSSIDDNLEGREPGKNTNFLDRLTGHAGVKNIQDTLNVLRSNYGDMINHYYGYKDSLGGLITEFSLMRDRIADIYRRRSLELIDLFGDRIKAVDPELFDFARIEWLDVRAMQEAAHLHYDQVVQSSLVAMRKINDSINQRAKQSLEGFNNGIGAGLISLGLNFVGHHLDSIAITHELRAELENFKLRLHSDATTVQTDVMRLFTIYKALNDVAIPRAKKFHEFSDRVFDHSFQTLVDAYYNRGNLKELRQKRNEKLKDLHEAEQFVSRHRGAIEHHRTQAEGLDENLKGLRRFYKRAKSARPTRWPAFFNLLTFGIHNHNYEERYRQWYEVHGALYEAYREMEAQHKEHRREVKAYGKKLAVVEKEKLKFQAEVNGMSLQIRRAERQDPINTPEIAARLGDVVRLLRLAREITQTSLDERLLKATVPYQFNQVSMPAQSQRALSQLQAELQNKAAESALETQAIVQARRQELAEAKNPQQARAIVEEIRAEKRYEQLNQDLQRTAGSVLNVLSSYLALRQVQAESVAQQRKIDQDAQLLRGEFSRLMRATDERSAVLREVFAKINTAGNEEEVKDAFLALSDGTLALDERELDRFLRGQGDLTL